MRQNFNELFSKMKPEAQERVNARSSELLQEMALADLRRAQASTQNQTAADDELTPSSASNKTS